MRHLRVFVPALTFLFEAGICQAAPPSWWSVGETKVIDDRPGVSHAVSDNYVPINLGQLKNVAKKAALHLDLNLPNPGADSDIHDLVDSFYHDANDYAPANLGQLKAIAKPFYLRLEAIGFPLRDNLISRGYPSSWVYNTPWNPNTPKADNYAPANLGQLKMTFSFDLAAIDTDNDGISDPWEMNIFGNLNHDSSTDTDADGVSDLEEVSRGHTTDWNDFFNGQAPILVIASGDHQGDLPGNTLAQPLKVVATNSNGSVASSGAVTFVITSSTGGSLSPGSSISIGVDGTAQTYATLPSATSSIGTAFTVKATMNNGSGIGEVTFNLSVGDPAKSPARPSAPIVTEEHGATTALIEWEDRSDNETAFYVERSGNSGATWATVATLPANSTSYTDTGLTPDLIYYYRIVAYNSAP